VSDFWEGKHIPLAAGQPLTFSAIPPHGSHLIAVRRVASGPQLVASSFHFSQGAEIVAWETAGRSLRFRIELGRVADGEVRLSLPGAPQSASVDGQRVATHNLGGGMYLLQFNVQRAAEVAVKW
jgi:hypothetical protein